MTYVLGMLSSQNIFWLNYGSFYLIATGVHLVIIPTGLVVLVGHPVGRTSLRVQTAV